MLSLIQLSLLNSFVGFFLFFLQSVMRNNIHKMLLLGFPPVDFYGIYIYKKNFNLHLKLSSINVHVHEVIS